MDISECIKNRRSIRKYLNTEIPKDKIGMIIEAGLMAPSSGNIQNWNFTVIKDPEKREKLADACLQQHWMTQAPVHIIVCGVEDIAKQFYGLRGEKLYTIQNCSACIQNMLLMAHSLGLGSCWIGAFDEGMIKNIAGIPDNARPQAIITIGIADEKPEPPKREALYNFYYLENYMNRIEDFDVALGYHGNVALKKLNKGTELAKKQGNKLFDKIQHHSKKLMQDFKQKN